jgi:hypothetical protein
MGETFIGESGISRSQRVQVSVKPGGDVPHFLEADLWPASLKVRPGAYIPGSPLLDWKICR